MIIAAPALLSTMQEFWFIRHGESATNAGLTSDSDQSTVLTELGHQQARHVAAAIPKTPNLFVVSPYLRTSLTAQPTLERFPAVDVTTWPIQEYSYLPHDQYRDTTTSERRRLSENYFRVGDPDLVLGEGGESFNMFIGRVRSTLESLSRSNHDFTVLFGHGWFMRACLWLMYMEAGNTDRKKFVLDQVKKHLGHSGFGLKLFGWLSRRKRVKTMHQFLVFSAAVETPNCSILKFSISEDDEIDLAGFRVDHLPPELRKTSLRNR
jgi:broad specificity phosphatase PhoE